MIPLATIPPTILISLAFAIIYLTTPWGYRLTIPNDIFPPFENHHDHPHNDANAPPPPPAEPSRPPYPELPDEPPINLLPPPDDSGRGNGSNVVLLEQLLMSLSTMQDEYFEHWQGTWPSAIDWTGAFIQTALTGGTGSLAAGVYGGGGVGFDSEGFFGLNEESRAGRAGSSGEGEGDGRKEEASVSRAKEAITWKTKENLIDSFFTQILGSYYGQNALSLREQAFDDMLWVVLGWLESVVFVKRHGERDYSTTITSQQQQDLGMDNINDVLTATPYHGLSWTPTFAHRARVFWDLASKGWGERLCGGGMTWNPRLTPYKNAITNELWIAASIKMYLWFPGDDIASPFDSPSGRGGSGGSAEAEGERRERACQQPGQGGTRSGGGKIAAKGGNPHLPPLPPCPPHDPKFLDAAKKGYAWLASSNMTNHAGLFVDGYHVKNVTHGGTNCDERNEMVYTYNQGVLLTGCRGLFEATGWKRYLEDGHKLIGNVIKTSGWDLEKGGPVDDIVAWFGDVDGSGDGSEEVERGGKKGKVIPPWRGLGRVGVLEEVCDAQQYCSQNGQTFKGIFFHHLTEFCAPLGDESMVWPLDFDNYDADSIYEADEAEHEQWGEDKLDKTFRIHRERCKRYIPWINHNARSALLTRDQEGKFGMWWTAGLLLNDNPPANSSSTNFLDIPIPDSDSSLNPNNLELLLMEAELQARRTEAESESHIDYRNSPLPQDGVWLKNPEALPPWNLREGNGAKRAYGMNWMILSEIMMAGGHTITEEDVDVLTKRRQKVLGGREEHDDYDDLDDGASDGGEGGDDSTQNGKNDGGDGEKGDGSTDPNTRGRGRTVETQSGGVSVLRAALEFSLL